MIKFSSHSGINTLKVSQELDISLDEATEISIEKIDMLDFA